LAQSILCLSCDQRSPRGDFSDFFTGERMYPSMMKPEVKRRWDLKNCEWEETKAQHAKLKRMVHAQFMQENPNLPVVQKLKETTYGNKIQNEFKKYINTKNSELYEFYQKESEGVDRNSLQNPIDTYVENEYRNMDSTSATPPKKLTAIALCTHTGRYTQSQKHA